MRLIERSFLFIFAFLTIATISCDGKDKNARRPSPLIHPDKWLLTGRVANDGFSNGEVLALALDGMRYRAPIASDASFGIALPGNSSYAIHFLTREHSEAESAEKISPSNLPPLLNYEESPDVGIRDTLRLPKVLFNRELSFGEIDIKDKEAYPTINPAIKLDFDYDGFPDLLDKDDNNDGLSDEQQKQAHERVELCHTSEDSRTTTQKVALSTLYHHTSHGDPLGPCTASVAPNPDAFGKNSFGGSQGSSPFGTGAAGNSSKKIANDWRPTKEKTNPTAAAEKKKEEAKKPEDKKEDKKTEASKDDKKTGTTKKTDDTEGVEDSGDEEEEEEEEEEEDSDYYYSDDEESEEDDIDRRDRDDEDNDNSDESPKKPRRAQTSKRGKIPPSSPR